MTKKKTKAKTDEHEDEDKRTADDEEEASEGEERAQEDEEERPVAKASERRRARPKARREAAPVHDDHDHGHDDHGDEHAEDDEDPYWWAPHAVMTGLVLVGVLGFFGVFNRIAGTIMGKPGPAATTASESTSHAKPTTPSHPPRPASSQAQAPREMFGAKHLLVMHKEGRRAPPGITRTKDEAKTRAEEAQKKAKGGAKFEDLVKDYSDEPRAAERGGDLGRFAKGQMVPEFQAAVEKLKVGEVSGVVETPFGFHVILRTQ